MASDSYQFRPISGQVTAPRISGQLFSDALAGLQENLSDRRKNVQAEQAKAQEAGTQALIARIQQADQQGLSQGSVLGDALRGIQQDPQSGFDLAALNTASLARGNQLRDIADQQEAQRIAKAKLGLEQEDTASSIASRAEQDRIANLNAQTALGRLGVQQGTLALSQQAAADAKRTKQIGEVALGIHSGRIDSESPAFKAMNPLEQAQVLSQVDTLKRDATIKALSTRQAGEDRVVDLSSRLSKTYKDPDVVKAITDAVSRGVPLQTAIQAIPAGETILPFDDFDADDFAKEINRIIGEGSSGIRGELSPNNVEALRNRLLNQ